MTVTPLPSRTDRLVKRGLQAMEAYSVAMMDEAKGRRNAIQAVVEYGKVLQEGRDLYASNNAFSAWVEANGLDQGEPWKDRKEREKAKKIAEIVGGKTPPNTFDDCPNTRPTDIMKWYRAKHPDPNNTKDPDEPKTKRGGGSRKKELGGEKFKEACGIIRPLIEAGQDYRTVELEAKHGISRDTFERAALAMHEAMKSRAEVLIQVQEDRAVADAGFSEKGRMTIQKAIDIYHKRILKDLQGRFHQQVAEEVRNELERIDAARTKSLSELSAANTSMRILLNQQAFYTPQEFKVILLALHPDNAASPEVRARAFDLLRKQEKRLVKSA